MKKLFLIIVGFFHLQMQAEFFSDDFTQKQAHDAYQSGQFAQAESLYTKLLTQNPYDVKNNYNLGCVLHKQKKFDDAQNYFNRAITHAVPNSKQQEQALFNRGNNYVAQKKFDDAIADYKQVLKINPDNQSAKKNLKACQEMKKEQKKQDQQKDKQKNNEQNKEQKDQKQDGSNQDSSNDSGNQSDQNDQSSNQKKENKGNQKDQGKNGSQNQQGDTKKESQDQKESKQQPEDGLQKSKEQKSKDKKEREQQKPQETEHKKSSQKSQLQQSTSSEKNGKDQEELHDAYAQKMMAKPSDDDRLDKRSAMLLEKLDDYEKNIQKKLLQMNVTKQGAQKHGQKNW